jgi:hypothetical protein
MSLSLKTTIFWNIVVCWVNQCLKGTSTWDIMPHNSLKVNQCFWRTSIFWDISIFFWHVSAVFWPSPQHLISVYKYYTTPRVVKYCKNILSNQGIMALSDGTFGLLITRPLDPHFAPVHFIETLLLPGLIIRNWYSADEVNPLPFSNWDNI